MCAVVPALVLSFLQAKSDTLRTAANKNNFFIVVYLITTTGSKVVPYVPEYR
jgi:hypothetical protein